MHLNHVGQDQADGLWWNLGSVLLGEFRGRVLLQGNERGNSLNFKPLDSLGGWQVGACLTGQWLVG